MTLDRRQFLVGLAATYAVGCHHARPLRFGQLNAVDATIPYLADALGYFARDKVEVRVSLQPSGATIVQNMNSVADALDLGVMGLPPLSAMIAQNRVQPVVIATVSGSSQTCRLLTFATTGIRTDPATMKGRKVGYTVNTVSHQYLTRLLAKAQLRLADVQGFGAPQ